MSDTPNAADDVCKLLDADCTVILRKNRLGSYFAVCVRPDSEADGIIRDAVDKVVGWDGEEEDDDGSREFGDNMPGVIETDDFTPSKVLYRLTEKATTGRIA